MTGPPVAPIVARFEFGFNGTAVAVTCPLCGREHRHRWAPRDSTTRDAVCGRGTYTIQEQPDG